MSKRILVAEDDSAIIEVMKIILQEAEYEVFTADTSKEIIEIIEKEKPQLLLLDIWLSGENGGEIAKILRSKDNTKYIPIIMVSANNETEKIAREVGAQDFLQKPFDIENLLVIVKKHILTVTN